MFAVLAMVAAACSDPSALARPNPVGVSEGESALGPTITVPGITTMPTAPPIPPIPPPPPPPEPVTVLAVGNLGGCNAHSTQVVEAIAADRGLIFSAGDLLIDPAAAGDCSLTSIEAQLDRLYTVPGDRDLAGDQATVFYDLTARTPTSTNAGEGWFVTMLGGWQIIGLNSRCDEAGGCGVDSAQYQWLDALLREQPAECRAVIWHDARFTSTRNQTEASFMGAILGRLDGAGTDVVITGSPSNYERLGPVRPSGQLAVDGAPGTMHFNIGGGSGAGFNEELRPGTQLRQDVANGYVRFVFSAASYTWEFVATSDGNTEPDIGSGTC